MSTTTVSVVIPTIGRPSLARAIDSVRAQDFDGSVEVVVCVDADASSNAVSAEVGARYDRLVWTGGVGVVPPREILASKWQPASGSPSLTTTSGTRKSWRGRLRPGSSPVPKGLSQPSHRATSKWIPLPAVKAFRSSHHYLSRACDPP